MDVPHRRRMAFFPRAFSAEMQRPLTATVLSRQDLREASNESFDCIYRPFARGRA